MGSNLVGLTSPRSQVQIPPPFCEVLGLSDGPQTSQNRKWGLENMVKLRLLFVLVVALPDRGGRHSFGALQIKNQPPGVSYR